MGFILALLVLLVAVATALGLVAGAHLLWWMIALLALAVLIGSWGPPVPWRRQP